MTDLAPGAGTQATSWPCNELEQTLDQAVGLPDAGLRLLQVLARSPLWVPLPEGGGPDSPSLSLPTLAIDGGVYVPVFSSAEQFMIGAGPHLSYAIAPGWEFARGLPPQAGIVVNPGGTIGAPVPPKAVAELCRATPGQRLPGRSSGARMRLFEPDWQEEPVDFLGAAAGELAALGWVRTARRGLASAEGGPPALYLGVETDLLEPQIRVMVQGALGRALARQPVRWPVQLLLLDAAEDPVVHWMRQCITPFYDRDR
ncbi:enhanced serine sensitivity protein SseB C-terminal domain-containing protein [Streptomyces aidingensis]|uniref:SseB protein N-terminal domain-containing protein n=1 Tax=Streptomyces aidingensis TaxID=910347 RepID=A0A1I1NKB0_9ACTN|nr:enhanced serine sensitivity protein SseB C-terminal domain-containing protein [Streptomyces aidingensis]SFC97977.1 SseB protein N-terminal domain-containing protein [Streptomyces aidingensis]